MTMILQTKGCFHILLDLLLVTIPHMDILHMVILLNHILNRATHLPVTLLPEDTHLQVTLTQEDTLLQATLPQEDTLLQAILLQVVTLLLVILAHQLLHIQGTDLAWGRSWLEVLLLQLLLMGLITCHMDMVMVVLAVGNSSMGSSSTESLESTEYLGSTKCLESTRANSLRDGSDFCLLISPLSYQTRSAFSFI